MKHLMLKMEDSTGYIDMHTRKSQNESLLG